MELNAETRFRLLLEIAQKLRDTLDLDDIISHILDIVQSIVPYDAGGIFILNQEMASLQYGPALNIIAGVARRGYQMGSSDNDPMLAQGKGIVGRVIRTGKSANIPDVRLDPDYVEGRSTTHAELAVPIILHERVIGALNIECDRPAAYDESDLELLCFFADITAISVEKAVLHRQILGKEILEKQLETACEVQSRLLPKGSPGIPGYDISGLCIPTEEIGGDYFDYIHLPQERLGLAVADVSGHGIPAALVMTAFRALLRTHGHSYARPARIARSINHLLPEFTADQHFVTALYTVLEPATGSLEYANCGHPGALLLRADGRTEKLERRGPALGIFEDPQYPSGMARMEPGDVLALYTDGVVEHNPPGGDRFGVERLVSTLRSGWQQSAEHMAAQVVQEARRFSGLSNFPDDFTLVIVRRIL